MLVFFQFNWVLNYAVATGAEFLLAIFSAHIPRRGNLKSFPEGAQIIAKIMQRTVRISQHNQQIQVKKVKIRTESRTTAIIKKGSQARKRNKACQPWNLL